MSYAHATYHVNHPDDPFNQRIMDRLNDEAVEDLSDPSTWTAETVKKAAQHFQTQSESHQAGVVTQQNADAWIQAHPEYVDSPANGQRMRHELKTMGLENKVATLDDFDIAFARLRSDNLVTLNKDALQKQKIAADKARAEAHKNTKTFSEDELYSMDLQELRMRANGVF